MWITQLTPGTSVSAALIAAGGDVNCQYIITPSGSTFSWDSGRTFRFGFLGFVLIAPCTHFWYGWLASTFPGTGALAIAKRVAFDQLVYAPTFIPAFFMSVKLLEGTPLQQSADDLIAQFPDIYKTNLLVWVPASSINFAFVPVKFMVLFGNVVGLFWNTYLSYVSNSVDKEEGKPKDEEEKKKLV